MPTYVYAGKKRGRADAPDGKPKRARVVDDDVDPWESYKDSKCDTIGSTFERRGRTWKMEIRFRRWEHCASWCNDPDGDSSFYRQGSTNIFRCKHAVFEDLPADAEPPQPPPAPPADVHRSALFAALAAMVTVLHTCAETEQQRAERWKAHYAEWSTATALTAAELLCWGKRRLLQPGRFPTFLLHLRGIYGVLASALPTGPQWGEVVVAALQAGCFALDSEDALLFEAWFRNNCVFSSFLFICEMAYRRLPGKDVAEVTSPATGAPTFFGRLLQQRRAARGTSQIRHVVTTTTLDLMKRCEDHALVKFKKFRFGSTYSLSGGIVAVSVTPNHQYFPVRFNDSDPEAMAARAEFARVNIPRGSLGSIGSGS
eukprot:gene8203-5181_t